MILRKPDMFACQTCLFFSQTVRTAPFFWPLKWAESVSDWLHTWISSLPSCWSLLFWRNKRQEISFWNKSGSFWEYSSHQPGLLSHRFLSVSGRKHDSEGMQLCSLSLQEEKWREPWVKNNLLLFGIAICLRHRSYTHQWAFRHCAPDSGMER